MWLSDANTAGVDATCVGTALGWNWELPESPQWELVESLALVLVELFVESPSWVLEEPPGYLRSVSLRAFRVLPKVGQQRVPAHKHTVFQ